MKKPGLLERMSPRGSLLACISLMGLGILVGNFVGGPIGPATAAVLVVLGSMFGLSYLREVNR